MKSTRVFLLCTAAAAAFMGATTFASGTAEAAIQCRGRMSGEGTGMGIAGQGSALARSNALADFGRKAEARHGKAFGNTALARSVRYDCRQGAILEAKCVVSAVPCGDVPTRRKGKRARR